MLPTIGNAIDAHTAYMHSLGSSAPCEWQYLGSGSYRDVYLSPNNVVYKVNIDSGDYGYNISEYENYLRIKDYELPDWLHIPIMSMYGDVIAAQYVNATKLNYCTFKACICGGIWNGQCQVYLHDYVDELLDISDMHNDNLLPIYASTGLQWWAIDLGH